MGEDWRGSSDDSLDERLHWRSFNLYFEENQDISAECTMTFNKLESVKGASLLVNMGMSFLDFKPEFAQLKRLIDFKVYDKNLLIDVAVTETS